MEHTDAASQMGRTVEASMERVGLSQRSLAESTGIPLATLNRSINGHRSFKYDELARIAIVLKVRPSDLVAAAEVA